MVVELVTLPSGDVSHFESNSTWLLLWNYGFKILGRIQAIFEQIVNNEFQSTEGFFLTKYT